MSQIKIVDLEVFYFVGVPDAERSAPQRLLLSIDMTFDFSAAAASDNLEKTIDYFSVAQRLLGYGSGRSWKLIETLAADIAATIMAEYRPQGVVVEVKKFVIPQAAYVSVIYSTNV